MVLRIPYNSLPRLAAQRQTPPFQHLLQRLPVATQHPFSTSPTRRQASKQEPAVPETSTPTPISTSDPTIPTTVPIADPAQPNNTLPPPPPPKKKSHIVPAFLFAASFLLVGFVSGTSLRLFISPPTPPLPGTDEDKYLTSALHEQAAKLPLVKQLTADPSWESWDAYSSVPEAHKKQHIAAGALQGSRGVGGYQRIFYNKSTGEFVSVIFFGPATTGWPGVVHGGCLATILDESCGRAAFKQWGGLPGVTASLRINYNAATLASGFYLIRVKPRQEEDLPEGERGKKHYKVFVDATVEDPVTGKVNVVADALFVGGSKNRKGGLFSKLGDRNDEAHARF